MHSPDSDGEFTVFNLKPYNINEKLKGVIDSQLPPPEGGGSKYK